jgi:DNA repair/transcription protein MET18/MMS19
MRLNVQAAASSAEKDLIAIYSSVVQGVKTEVSVTTLKDRASLKYQAASPHPSAADFLASKVYWTIRVATDNFQVKWALDLITAFVNKRVNGEPIFSFAELS